MNWSLIMFSWGSASDIPVVSVSITPSGHTFASWSHDSSGWSKDDCNWWNGTFYYDPGVCSTFAVTRLASGDVSRAIERASFCALAGSTECVLNGEIGFAVPSAFIYDADSADMKMVIAPRILEQSEPRTIRLQDPFESRPNQIFSFNSTLNVEFLKGGPRSMATETLVGSDAYCIQALRSSIAPVCWESLD